MYKIKTNPGLSMLIVDDEPLVCEGLKAILDWSAYGVTTIHNAENAAQAIDLVEKTAPDIVLCDIRMHGMDGLSLIEELKARFPDTVYIIISGYDDFEYAKKAISLGVFYYITKPVMHDEFEQVIERCVAQIAHSRQKQPHEDSASESLLGNIIKLEGTRKKSRIDDIINHIQANLTKNLSLHSVSSQFYYNQSYFCRLFREETGMHFVDYINRQRVELAKKLLTTTDMPAYKVCERVGYKDYRHFAEVFKKYAGTSPNYYKKGNV